MSFYKFPFSGVDMLMKAVGKDCTSLFSILCLNFLPLVVSSGLALMLVVFFWTGDYFTPFKRFWLLVFPPWISPKEPSVAFLLVKSFICRSYNLQVVPTPRKSVPSIVLQDKWCYYLSLLLLSENKEERKN